MAAWSEGYFTDVQYTGHYYGYLAPTALAFACLRRGVRPPPMAPGATYLELGCGQGFGLNLLAAANPHLNFIGIDFHPGQIANARTLAAEAGLTNIVFHDLSFEQALALPEGRLPKCEVIALHGIVSWISPENRARIVSLLDRLLEPGGIAAVSYNTYPGWAAILPLQRFVKEHVLQSRGDPLKAVVEALQAAQQMADSGHGTFARAPQLKAQIQRMLKGAPAYLLHELVHENFHPMFHAEVVRELETARLTYVGQAHSVDDSASLTVPEPHQKRVEDTADPVQRETLIDYATDRLFRRDIYVRGANPMTPLERADRLGGLRFALLKPAGRISFEFKIPIGTLNGDVMTYGVIAAALSEGPRRYDELAAIPALAGKEAHLLKALGLFVDKMSLHPVLDPPADPAPAQAFNGVLFDRFRRDRTPGYLASPTIGAGVILNFTELLGLAAPGGSGDPQAAARYGCEILQRTGVRVQKDGRALTEQAETEAELAERLTVFDAEQRPVLKALGVF